MATKTKTRSAQEAKSLGATTQRVEGGVAARGKGVAELAREKRGVVFVEYVALLLLVTIGGAAAVVTLGVPLVTLFRYVQAIVALPVP